MIFHRERQPCAAVPAIPQQPRPERPPWTPPAGQFGSFPLDARFDPCGAPPLNAESLGEHA